MSGIVLLITVIEIDVPAFKVAIGQQGKHTHTHKTINQSDKSTLLSQNELLK